MRISRKPTRVKLSLKWIHIIYGLVILLTFGTQYVLFTKYSNHISEAYSLDSKIIGQRGEALQQVINEDIPLSLIIERLYSTAMALQYEMRIQFIKKTNVSADFKKYSQKLLAINKQLLSLKNDHVTVLSALTESNLILSKIASDAANDYATSDFSQLYQDTHTATSRVIANIEHIRNSLKSHMEINSQQISNDITLHEQSSVARYQRQKKYNQLYIVLMSLIIFLPFIILTLLLSQLYKRINMIENYANDIAHEKYSLPPFVSPDPTGRLALILCLVGRKIRSSLRESRHNADQTKKALGDAEQLASYDPLTGLVNRRYFNNFLNSALNTNKTNNYLLFLDLDNFKDINDVLGHDIGDKLLKSISNKLNNTVRPDDVVCRMGGDEFAIFLHNCRDDIEPVLKRLLSNIREPLDINNETIRSSMSIGVVNIKPGVDVETLMKHADLAMYHAKQSGRNTYRFFTYELEERVVRRQEILHELRLSLANRDFELFYQPKISLQSNCIKGYEALIRWRHPEKGLIPPDDFIPAVEESEIIHPLGMWVLEEACTQSLTLQKLGIMIPVSINVSPKQFFAKNFLRMVETVIAQTKMPPKLLELEITETILMDNLDTAIEVLNTLRAKGIRISIDDFGTGYSSMKYLRDLPVDTMKIDKSFLSHIHQDSKDKEIISAMAGLGNKLGMEVIAEGIETLEHMNFLKQIGCDTGQGYLFSKPLPFSELKMYIENTEKNKLDQSNSSDNSPSLYLIKPRF